MAGSVKTVESKRPPEMSPTWTPANELTVPVLPPTAQVPAEERTRYQYDRACKDVAEMRTVGEALLANTNEDIGHGPRVGDRTLVLRR